MSDEGRCDVVLKSLSISPGKLSPGFSSQRKQYFAQVGYDTEAVTVAAEAGAADSAVSVNGRGLERGRPSEAIPLRVGRNMIEVEVASAGRQAATYTIRVIRSHPTPNWVRASESAPWVPRDSAGEVVFGGRMWIFGGYTPELVSDVWSSPDGVNWSRGGSIPCQSGINIPVTFVYDDKMWVTSHDGKLFASADGERWSLVTDRAPWRGRYAAGSVVFDGRMWVMGGCGGGRLFNDIWSSADGVHWTLEAAEAPWSRRQLFSMAAVHAGKIWLLGGGITNYHPFRAYRDVWSSPDGRNWTKVSDCAPWPARIWSSSAVYMNRLWVLTGFRAEPTWNNFSDVWYSADGEHWRELVTEAIWAPRHEVSVYVFDEKLWVVGGNAWPLMNDSWYLEIPGLSFLTQPVIEEFATAQYSYRACADFNRSCRPVRYRLVSGPEWLSVDSESGLVHGTPPSAGDVGVTIEAYDDAGESVQQCYTLHVLPI